MEHKEWRSAVLQEPLKHGWNGILLVLTTLVITGICFYFGLALFPPGNYPRLVLGAPGLIAGGIYFFAASGFFYNLGNKTA